MPTDFSQWHPSDLLSKSSKLCRPFYSNDFTAEQVDFVALAEIWRELKQRNSRKYKGPWVYLQPDWPQGQKVKAIYDAARKQYPDLPPIVWTGNPQKQYRHNTTDYIPTQERRFGRRA